jgi:hypothetical protein
VGGTFLSKDVVTCPECGEPEPFTPKDAKAQENELQKDRLPRNTEQVEIKVYQRASELPENPSWTANRTFMMILSR